MSDDVDRVRLSARLTPKGVALVRELEKARHDVASVWREPFETYDAAQRMGWEHRLAIATRVYESLKRQI